MELHKIRLGFLKITRNIKIVLNLTKIPIIKKRKIQTGQCCFLIQISNLYLKIFILQEQCGERGTQEYGNYRYYEVLQNVWSTILHYLELLKDCNLKILIYSVYTLDTRNMVHLKKWQLRGWARHNILEQLKGKLTYLWHN